MQVKTKSGNILDMSSAVDFHVELERDSFVVVADFADGDKARLKPFENKDDADIYVKILFDEFDSLSKRLKGVV